MEAAAGQDGIQRLLQAEQEAQAVVARARKGKIPFGNFGLGAARSEVQLQTVTRFVGYLEPLLPDAC